MTTCTLCGYRWKRKRAFGPDTSICTACMHMYHYRDLLARAEKHHDAAKRILFNRVHRMLP